MAFFLFSDCRAARPKPRDPANADLVFMTKYGRPWATGGTSDAVTLETGKLLRKLNLHRAGRAFYSLRHTFRTVADATRDIPAVRLVMGHVDDSIDDVYREDIDDGRLQAVADHVRQWLFGAAPDGITGEPEAAAEAGDPGEQSPDGAGSDRPTLRLYAG